MLNVRKDVHARLRLVDFVRVSTSVHEFVRDVAHLCPQPFSALSAELQAHAHEFLRTAHDEATRKLDAIVEQEQWKQVEVAPEFQQMADAFARKQVRATRDMRVMRDMRCDMTDHPHAYPASTLPTHHTHRRTMITPMRRVPQRTPIHQTGR